MATGNRINGDDVTSGSQIKANIVETMPDCQKVPKSGTLFQNPTSLLTQDLFSGRNGNDVIGKEQDGSHDDIS